jgi:hypothetical protein
MKKKKKDKGGADLLTALAVLVTHGGGVVGDAAE